MPTSPATATGYVSDDVWMQRVYTDLVEYVPDLVWPTSVQTYNQMRRDPALTAILAAYTLPLRRATWNIDPTGCRPEVAQLVADDLGLPVAGMDTPGAARTRGVSWREHLRMALLHLTYGHFGFEAEADVTSGRARLVTLSERMPQTISELHVDRQGQLTGISQVQPPDNQKRRDPDVPDIPADRLVWYAHDREGAAWYGNSLLRPAFAPWLLKREMQRVFATANRRFGMGVPTGQWMPGTDPTPGQHAQLAQAVMAARVGDTSGVALPPGAFIELVGLTGSAPDTLGFMKWLDQQMSRMALAGFLDLGQTETGSRALGQSFIDLFLLNIQSIADYVADVATREIAARIVGWNWGDTEPVPAVQVADVGSRREVTAESLQALLVSGALSSDPALEEYVRREWRLPERTAPAVTPPAVTASRPRARRQQSGQGALFAAAGDEPDPAVDPDQAEADQHQQEWEAASAAMLAAAPVLLAPAVDDLTEQVRDRLSAGNVAALAGLVVGGVVVSALAGRLVDAMTPLTLSAAAAVAASAARQGVNVRPSKSAGGQRNRQVAKVTARLVVTGLAQSATRVALASAGPGVDAATVAGQVRSQLDMLVAAPTGWVADQFGAVLSASQNSGRAAVFAKVPPKLLRAVEINDRNRCGPCADVDQTTFPTLEAALAAYPTGGYVHCAGGLRCRGFLVAQW